MSSWFSGSAFDTLNDLKNKVQSSVNSIDPDLIQKLTLQSPELAAERERIDNEERRKENVRDTLAEILPWDTRDAEMEILVDECKEAILGLSAREETFTGPFVLDGGLPSGEEEGEGEVDSDLKAAKDLEQAEKSAGKLSKLQPLPALLADFDLDTHVGLIQRLFEVDPKLVEMHSRLSSGGKRELTFWKNYFFHCAYTRYEAGLSIDEIWSNEPRKAGPAVATKVEETDEYDIVDNEGQSQSDEEVVFESVSSTGSTGKLEFNDTTTMKAKQNQQEAVSSATNAAPESPKQISTATKRPAELSTPGDTANDSEGAGEYELVAGDIADDGSMDELEAEIAAALGD